MVKLLWAVVFKEQIWNSLSSYINSNFMNNDFITHENEQ